MLSVEFPSKITAISSLPLKDTWGFRSRDKRAPEQPITVHRSHDIGWCSALRLCYPYTLESHSRLLSLLLSWLTTQTEDIVVTACSSNGQRCRNSPPSQNHPPNCIPSRWITIWLQIYIHQLLCSSTPPPLQHCRSLLYRLDAKDCRKRGEKKIKNKHYSHPSLSSLTWVEQVLNSISSLFFFFFWKIFLKTTLLDLKYWSKECFFFFFILIKECLSAVTDVSSSLYLID